MIEKEEKDNIWEFAKSPGKKSSFSRNAARWWNTYASDATKDTTTDYESKFSPSELAPKMKAINDALGVDWKTVAD